MAESEDTTTTSQPVAPRQMSNALRYFERHPSHPDALIKPDHTRHAIFATLGSAVVILGTVVALFLSPQRILEEWFFVAMLTMFPWWLLMVKWLSERQKQRNHELVWVHHPDYAMARLKAYHMEGRGNSNELWRKHKLGRAVAIASLCGAIALMLCVVVNILNPEYIQATFSSAAILFGAVIGSTICAILMGMSLISTITSTSAKAKHGELQAERAHLKSIAPELFTQDELEGAISLPGDDPDIKGALSQS
jgi:5-bromo-4-chloroindolyl phosphate hydrolysis protein